MTQDVTVILNGFLKLPNPQKMELVGAINEYFDELNKREAFRADVEAEFRKLRLDGQSFECICCGQR